MRRSGLSAALGRALGAIGRGIGGFPRAGIYDIVREFPDRLERTDMWLDLSNRRAFEQFVARDGGSRCRDREVSIGRRSFRVRMTCDAPDGDLHGIGLERSGTYSENSIDMTTDTILWGTPIRETSRYRLRED